MRHNFDKRGRVEMILCGVRGVPFPAPGAILVFSGRFIAVLPAGMQILALLHIAASQHLPTPWPRPCSARHAAFGHVAP